MTPAHLVAAYGLRRPAEALYQNAVSLKGAMVLGNFQTVGLISTLYALYSIFDSLGDTLGEMLPVTAST